MSEARALPPPMTADEFIGWPGDGINRLHQLIDGEPVAMAAASWRHGAIAVEISTRLLNHFRATGSPCVVVSEPGVQPRANARHNVRVPEIAVSCRPGAGHYLAEPLLIVEVLSPSNARETYEAARACLTIPSLREVLVVDSRATRAELLRRDADGSWPAEPILLGETDEVSLECVGLRFPLRDVYPD